MKRILGDLNFSTLSLLSAAPYSRLGQGIFRSVFVRGPACNVSLMLTRRLKIINGMLEKIMNYKNKRKSQRIVGLSGVGHRAAHL